MSDLDEPAGATVHLGHSTVNLLEPFGNRADLLLGGAVLNDTNEHQPEPKLAAQATRDARGSLRGVRIVNAADDRTSHRILLHRFPRGSRGSITDAIGPATDLGVEATPPAVPPHDGRPM
jgi:hypothetical protein